MKILICRTTMNMNSNIFNSLKGVMLLFILCLMSVCGYAQTFKLNQGDIDRMRQSKRTPPQKTSPRKTAMKDWAKAKSFCPDLELTRVIIREIRYDISVFRGNLPRAIDGGNHLSNVMGYTIHAKIKNIGTASYVPDPKLQAHTYRQSGILIERFPMKQSLQFYINDRLIAEKPLPRVARGQEIQFSHEISMQKIPPNATLKVWIYYGTNYIGTNDCSYNNNKKELTLNKSDTSKSPNTSNPNNPNTFNPFSKF